MTNELIITATVTLTASRFFSWFWNSRVRERNAESTKNGVRINRIFK
jgi:hypothetical protein